MPDIEHIYMSEKKSNHVKEKYDIKKILPLSGEMRKKLPVKSAKHEQFSRVTASTDSLGWAGLEKMSE